MPGARSRHDETADDAPPPAALLALVALGLSGCGDMATAAVVAIAAAMAFCFTVGVVLIGAGVVRVVRRRRLADASDNTYVEAPTLSPLSDADAQAISRAIADKRRRSGAMVCAVAMLAVSGCAHLTPKAASYITARVTGQSLDLAAESYATAYDAKADALYDEAIAACKGTGRAAFRPCVEGKMEPWSRAEKAIAVYRGLRKSGASVLDQQYIAAVADAISALAAVGIKVTP